MGYIKKRSGKLRDAKCSCHCKNGANVDNKPPFLDDLVQWDLNGNDKPSFFW